MMLKLIEKVESQIDMDYVQGAGKFLTQLCAEGRELVTQKDAAYAERNRLVALLSKLFPSSLERHSEEDTSWEDEWRWIVFIDTPMGQATWHIHDSELSMFDHLPRNLGKSWDGHSTAEKYERLGNAPVMHSLFTYAAGCALVQHADTYKQLAGV